MRNDDTFYYLYVIYKVREAKLGHKLNFKTHFRTNYNLACLLQAHLMLDIFFFLCKFDFLMRINCALHNLVNS